MAIPDPSALTPMVRKLAQRAPFDAAESAALLALPYRLAKLGRGAYITREGDRSKECCLLLSGFAYRSKVAGNGARQILSVHLCGDIIDLPNGLVAEADHSVQALTHATVAYIPTSAILQLLDEYPAIARALLVETMVEGSILREWLLNVGRRDARERIAHLLCELALRFEAAGVGNGRTYDLPLSQEQIGDATGLTSVHVNRTIQGLRRDGLISSAGQQLTIEDWAGLQAAGDVNSAYLHLGATTTADSFRRHDQPQAVSAESSRVWVAPGGPAKPYGQQVDHLGSGAGVIVVEPSRGSAL